MIAYLNMYIIYRQTLLEASFYEKTISNSAILLSCRSYTEKIIATFIISKVNTRHHKILHKEQSPLTWLDET